MIMEGQQISKKQTQIQPQAVIPRVGGNVASSPVLRTRHQQTVWRGSTAQSLQRAQEGKPFSGNISVLLKEEQSRPARISVSLPWCQFAGG